MANPQPSPQFPYLECRDTIAVEVWQWKLRIRMVTVVWSWGAAAADVCRVNWVA